MQVVRAYGDSTLLSIDAIPRLSQSNTRRDEYGKKLRNYPDFDLNAVLLPHVLEHTSKATLTRLTIEANYFAVGLGAVEFPQVTSIVVRCSKPEHEVERRRRIMEGYDTRFTLRAASQSNA